MANWPLGASREQCGKQGKGRLPCLKGFKLFLSHSTPSSPSSYSLYRSSKNRLQAELLAQTARWWPLSPPDFIGESRARREQCRLRPHCEPGLLISILLLFTSLRSWNSGHRIRMNKGKTRMHWGLGFQKMSVSSSVLRAREVGGLWTSTVSNHSCDFFYVLAGLNCPDLQKCHFPLGKFSLSWLNTHTPLLSSVLITFSYNWYLKCQRRRN